jgi:predicted nucleic acid binding AN1-type Zn finger protein
MVKKTKCSFCKKKTGLINFPCECGGVFCTKHRYSHSHDCSKLNEKKIKGKENIENLNPKTETAKVEKI